MVKSLRLTISREYFAHWLGLWIETINESFTGDIDERAKAQARKMITGQFIAVWQSRT